MAVEFKRTPKEVRADERATLESVLDHQRDTLEWKCTGLSEAQLKTAACPPSPITLLGLLRHMTEVEYYWFEEVLLGRAENVGVFGSEEEPEGDWTDLDSHPADEVFRRWHRSCEASHEHVTSTADLGQIGAKPRSWDGQTVSLRYILAHMIEEYARHLGHADFLRERIDGQTGV